MRNYAKIVGYFFIFTLLAIVLLLISCNNSVGKSTLQADNGIRYDTIKLARQYYLEGDTANPSCHINLFFVYPAESRKIDTDELQKIFLQNIFGEMYDSLSPSEAVDKYVETYIKSYKNDAETYTETAKDIADFDAIISDMYIDDSEQAIEKRYYSYFESISDSIVYDKHNVLSFQVKQSNNKGGADSYNSYRNYVIDLKNKVLLTENDIFRAGYDMALRTLFISSLLEQNGVKSVNELESLGYFGIDEIIPNHNFLINQDGIIYTFNKGEYSAYQLQAPEVLIPYSAIRSLLRENTVVQKLAEL